MTRVRRHDDHMRDLLDAMGDVVAMFGVDGTILAINEAGAAQLGLPRDELIGRCNYDLMPPEMAACRRQIADEVTRSGQPRHFVDMAGGRYQEHHLRPLRDADGRVTRLAVHVADVTDLCRADRERQAKSLELETIHAHVPVGILLVDAERRVTKANQAVARLAGVPREDIINRIGGAALGCLNHLDDERGCGYGPNCARCELRLALLHALEDGIIINALPVALPVEGPAGREVKNVLVSAAPVTLDGRSQVLVSLQDITRLRQAEADVAFKARVLDQIQDRVTVTDMQGTVVYVNNAACRSLKKAREELVGQGVSRLGEDAARGATHREIVEGTLANGAWQGEVVNIAADGTPALLHCRTSLVHDEQGAPVGMCGIATDITETRRREEQLRESERRFRRLHEQLPIGYFGLDREGRYVDANPAWLNLLGLPREQVEGCRFTDLLDDGHLERFAAARTRVQEGGEQQIECEIRGGEGQPVTVFCVGRGGLDNHGEVDVTHWVAADVSERRRLESQLWQAQKLDALGRLAAGVSHDFNNQLTVISGYCDILLGQVTEESHLRPALGQIRRAAERASATTGHLLSFSRKRDLAPREVDLNNLVRELIHPVSKLIGETIRVRMELSPRLRPVCVDPGALQQAVINLIINARDAMPDGGTLVLRTANRPAPAAAPGTGLVTLTVEDSGHGISAGDLERVFEPFFTTKGEGRGTGLGLPMVRGFAEQSGGLVEIQSRAGAGTTATIALPATAGAGPPIAQAAAAGEPERLAGRFLVVEDSEPVRDLMGDVLRRRGAEVVMASSPEEALRLAACSPRFDVVVTDIVMPGMRGDEMVSRLVAAGRVDRVVYMSGYQDKRTVALQGPLLSKPFAVQELVDMVRSVMQEPAAVAASGAPGRQQ
jgi:PAS domain S-box-containing protein